ELGHRPDEVRSLRFGTAGGGQFEVRARVFVLALGGIENARMLLASPGRDGRGVGNEHDLVGRCFMEHPIWDAAVIRPRDPGLVESLAAYGTREVNGVLVDNWLSPGEDVMRREGLLATAFHFLPEPSARLS